MGECIECGRPLTEEEFFENDAVCDDCADEDAFDHLGMYVIRGYRILDEEVVSCPDEEHVTIVYDSIETCRKRTFAA